MISKNKVYTCSISTNNGTIFKNGSGSTTLTAYAYNDGVDVSGNLEIRWSKDGTKFYVGKSVTVNAEDVDVKAVYSFTAYENGVKRGYYEVTITDVMDGEDGRISYLHIAYANSSDGYVDFSTTDSAGKQYIGQYVDYTERDSENPYMYKWTKIKGEDGTDGTIKSDTPPDDKTKLWYDTVNNVLKYWDGEKWVEAYTGDIEDAKDAAGNAQESANTAISSVNNINTSLEKYKNEVRAEFKNTVTYVDGKTEVIDTWVRQGSDGVTPFLELGGTSNDLKARLTNSRLGFYEGDKGLAYFGNEKAYMPVAEVDNLSAKRVGVGNYTMLDNGDGHLSLIYIE